jgi:hypothetical protein
MKSEENPKPAADKVSFSRANCPPVWFISAVLVLAAAALLFPFYQ